MRVRVWLWISCFWEVATINVMWNIPINSQGTQYIYPNNTYTHIRNKKLKIDEKRWFDRLTHVLYEKKNCLKMFLLSIFSSRAVDRGRVTRTHVFDIYLENCIRKSAESRCKFSIWFVLVRRCSHPVQSLVSQTKSSVMMPMRRASTCVCVRACLCLVCCVHCTMYLDLDLSRVHSFIVVSRCRSHILGQRLYFEVLVVPRIRAPSKWNV